MSKAKLHYLCDGNVVVYKRTKSKTNNWYARVKLSSTGRWKKFSTDTENLNEAKRAAEKQYDVLNELIKNGVAVDTRRFSHVADLVFRPT